MKNFTNSILIILFTLFVINKNMYSQTDELIAPILISPGNNDTLGVNDTMFVWNSVPGATSYRLWAAMDQYIILISIDTTIVGDTTLTLNKLIGSELRIGTKYYWRVKAYNDSSESPYSETRSMTALQVKKYFPTKSWYDVDNQLINAHGGGFLYDEPSKTYYWYGEARPESGWCAYGVSCYSSKNLLNWKFEGIVLSDSATNAIGETPVLERPKVIYNDNTKKYVMWMHIDYSNYGLANAGVAVSDSPTGPFEYLGSESPNNNMSRDMTLFKDDDGKAYLFSSSENNQTMYVSLLSDDYLSQSGTYKRILIGLAREAPAVFKYNNKYYMISSGCTGWDPNEARYAVANTPIGVWSLKGNPCKGEKANTTYGGQSTYVLPIDEGKYIFMADKWNSNHLISSTYIWLPLNMEDDKPVINWYSSWDMSIFDETTDIKDEETIVPNEFSLSQNYPNPFNPVTKINYTIPIVGTRHASSLPVQLKVYDLLGREVATLVNEMKSAGNYQVEFNASNLSSGVYLYKLQAGDYSISKKMVLLK